MAQNRDKGLPVANTVMNTPLPRAGCLRNCTQACYQPLTKTAAVISSYKLRAQTLSPATRSRPGGTQGQQRVVELLLAEFTAVDRDSCVRRPGKPQAANCHCGHCFIFTRFLLPNKPTKNQPTKSKEQSDLRFIELQSTDSPATSHILWNPKVHCHIHNSPFKTSHPIICL